MDACGNDRRPVLASMLDLSMGETMRTNDLNPAELQALRQQNERDKVQAPTQNDMPVENPECTCGFVGGCGVCNSKRDMPPVDVEFLQNAGLEVLDFTGDVDGGGVKMSMYDNYVNKPPMELVPQALTRAAARALGYGANKYAPNNWRRGMRWGEVFGGLIRHLTAWNEGEDIDSKENGGSGLNHLDHAAACLGFLCHMITDERYKKMDDRP